MPLASRATDQFIKYNGITFGSTSAVEGYNAFYSTPPEYVFNWRTHYDSSGRTIVGIELTLHVNSLFYPNPGLTADFVTPINLLKQISERLSEPGKQLTIKPLELTISRENILNSTTSSGGKTDIEFGPRPINVNVVPVSINCFEVSWTVVCILPPKFHSKSYDFSNTTGGIFRQLKEFNFSTTWINDFEGVTQRIIQGHWTVPVNVKTTFGYTYTIQAASTFRNQIKVQVPYGFRRVQSTFTESMDKSRMDFVIVDQMLQGEPLPYGVTSADAAFSFSTTPESGPSMNQGILSFEMTVKVSPMVPRTLPAVLFFTAALSKQAEVYALMKHAVEEAIKKQDKNPPPSGVIVPLHFSMTNGKFDNARVSSFKIAWSVTQRFNELLNATNIFAPVGKYLTAISKVQNDPPYKNFYANEGTWEEWVAGMARLWHPRGLSLLDPDYNPFSTMPLPEEGNNVSTGNKLTSTLMNVDLDVRRFEGLAKSTVQYDFLKNLTVPSLTCPIIPDDGGWIYVDIDVKLYRKSSSAMHRPQEVFQPQDPQPGWRPDGGQNQDPKIELGGVNYAQSTQAEGVLERIGFPDILVVLRFAGVRYSRTPTLPNIKNIDGKKVELIKDIINTPKIILEPFGCPVWAVSGARFYKAPGSITKIKPLKRQTMFRTDIPLEL